MLVISFFFPQTMMLASCPWCLGRHIYVSKSHRFCCSDFPVFCCNAEKRSTLSHQRVLLWPNMCEVKRKQAWDCPDWGHGPRRAWEEFRAALRKTWRRVFQAEKIAHRSLEKTLFFSPRITFKLDSVPLPSNHHFGIKKKPGSSLSRVLGYLQMMLIFISNACYRNLVL